MNITAYHFGRIDIDGRTYTSDVIVTPEGVLDTWWRKQGHILAMADLAEIVAARPEILVVGTGCYGRMAVSEETRSYLEAQGVQLRQARTAEAVKVFNQLQKAPARVVAALHVTC